LDPFKSTCGIDHYLMIDGSNIGQAPIDHINVERLVDPLKEVGWSLGDLICVNSFVYPKR